MSGQSFTTGNSTLYDRISISVYTEPGGFADGTNSSIGDASNPQADGSLFLLSGEYLGRAQDLSSTTAGFIAQSQSIAGGSWVFDSSVALEGNSEFWFYTLNYSFNGTVGFFVWWW